MDLCPNKALCGSCSWSDFPYERQLELKREAILKALPGCAEMLVMYPAQKTAHYRNRMDFAIDYQGRVGLREKGRWWRVIDGHHCFISDEVIEAEFCRVRTWAQSCGLSFFDRKRHVGLLRYALIRTTSRQELMLVIVTSTPKDQEEDRAARSALEGLAKLTKAGSFLWGRNSSIKDVSQSEVIEPIVGKEYIVEHIDDCEYEISPNAFFQTNSAMALVLQQRVLAAHKRAQSPHVLDLFCGSGFFSLALAKQGVQVCGVEMVEEAILAARRNALRNNVVVDFHSALAEQFDWKSLPCDMLVVDPPRSGLHPKLLSQICDRAPQNLVYVSCNFESLARELPALTAKYELLSCEAIDMFPHTPHVELVTHFRRRT